MVLTHIDFVTSNVAEHPALVVDKQGDILTCFKIASAKMVMKWDSTIDSRLHALLYLPIGCKDKSEWDT
jgi:hypothetical protein